MKTLKEKLELFDKEFDLLYSKWGMGSDMRLIKSFLSQTVKELLEEMVVEEKNICHHLECLATENGDSYCDCGLKTYLEGYAFARQDQLERMRRILT